MRAANNFGKAQYINTWYVEGEQDGNNFIISFFEYRTSDVNSLGENTISTTIDNIYNGDIYDLTGRRILKPANGIYIKSYKKDMK